MYPEYKNSYLNILQLSHFEPLKGAFATTKTNK